MAQLPEDTFVFPIHSVHILNVYSRELGLQSFELNGFS